MLQDDYAAVIVWDTNHEDKAQNACMALSKDIQGWMAFMR
jgi:hypothetical protein